MAIQQAIAASDIYDRNISDSITSSNSGNNDDNSSIFGNGNGSGGRIAMQWSNNSVMEAKVAKHQKKNDTLRNHLGKALQAFNLAFGPFIFYS